jgi:hypothetical protein
MSQQPPPYRYAGPGSDGEDAPTVTLRPPPYGPPPTLHGGSAAVGAPGGTNTMAILSVVFAFVFSPLGIVFGIVGRGQTRRTGQSGRGLATIGLALSLVFLVAGVAAVVYATVVVAQVASTVPADVVDQPGTSEPAAPSDAAPADQVPTGPAGTATVGVADGDYGPEVPSDALAEQVGAQSGATDVICPGFLPAQVDASTVCSGTVDGVSAQLQTQVTAVEGAEATVDITRVG